MKKQLLIFALFLTQITVFGQCSINVTGTNPTWCSSCSGSITSIATGVAPFHYQWSTGDTTNSINNLCAGTYVVDLIDNVGCTAQDLIAIYPTPQMNVNITTSPASCLSCYDGCILMSATNGCPPYSYNLLSNPPWWMPCENSPGSYTVVITDACGCTIVNVATVEISTAILNEHENTISLSFDINNKIITFSNPISDLTLFDSFGKLIFKFNNKETNQIILPDLPTGIYLLSALTNNGGLWTDKLFITK